MTAGAVPGRVRPVDKRVTGGIEVVVVEFVTGLAIGLAYIAGLNVLGSGANRGSWTLVDMAFAFVAWTSTVGLLIWGASAIFY